MSEWLDLMLEEIARKRREKDAALEELERRKQSPDQDHDQDDDKDDYKADDGPAAAQAK